MKSKIINALIVLFSIGTLLVCVSLFQTGCTTVPSTATITDKVTAICKQVPGDVELVLVPVLQHNPKYAPDVLLLGKTLPGLLQNGPIDAASIAGAVAQIPNLTAQERQDLVYIQVGLPAALQLYEAISGKSVVLYTDPNVSAIVTAFCQGLVGAAQAIPTS